MSSSSTRRPACASPAAITPPPAPVPTITASASYIASSPSGTSGVTARGPPCGAPLGPG